MRIYNLKGEKITLTNDLKHEFAREVATIANEKEICRMIGAHGFPSPYTEEDAMNFFEKNREAGKEIFAIDFLIFSKSRIVGVIGINQIDYEDKKAHIGYWLGKEHWNHGFATEAVALIAEFARAELGMRRLYSKVIEFNPASLKVLLKNNFNIEGFERESFKLDGKFYSFFLLGRLLDQI